MENQQHYDLDNLSTFCLSLIKLISKELLEHSESESHLLKILKTDFESITQINKNE